MNGKNKVKKARRVSIILVCILVPVGAFGFGYFMKQGSLNNKQVAHTLTVDGEIKGTIVEMEESSAEGIVPGDTVGKTINIKTNATAPSLLRVKIEPSWYDGDNKTSLSVSNIEIKYADNVKYNEFIEGRTDYWYENNDGYLYYMDSVTKQEAIALVKGIEFLVNDNLDTKDYQGKKLKIKVDMEMIQCKYSPYEKKWEIQNNIHLSNKLKELCSNK